MFRFENVYVLYALLLIPLLSAAYIYLQYKRKKKITKYADETMMERIVPERSKAKEYIKFALLMAALTCFIFALANPQVGSSLEKGKRKGVDIMVCLDISNSMLAEDIKPNRLDASKMALSRFIDKLKGDRIGLVVFAGKAFVQLPITSDYAAAKMFINYVTPEMMNEQGTDIAEALDLAVVSMIPEDDGNEDKQRMNALTSKVILVVSDGEDHFDEAVKMAGEVASLGCTIHTIGIGSTRGEPIPVRSANGSVSMKKDNEGNTVMTRLNEEILQEVAAAGKGIYVHAGNANMGFEKIQEKIDAMTKTDLDEVTFARYDSKFQYPLLLGLIFLFVEMLFLGSKNHFDLKKWLNVTQGIFKMKTGMVLLAIILCSNVLCAQTNEELSAIRRGNDKFKQSEKWRKEAMDLKAKGGEVNGRKASELMKKASAGYQEAELQYRKAMVTTKNYDKANYNLGTALYRQERYEEAAQYFKSVAEQTAVDPKLRSKAYHNLGNALMQQQNYGESVKAFKNSLKLDPSDMDTKYNLEYAKKKLQQQQQQQQQQNQGGGQDDNKDQQQNQQNQNGQNDKNQQDKQQNQNGQDKKDQNDKQDQQNGQNGQDKKDKNDKQQGQSAADKQKQQEDKRQLDALQQNERNTQQKVKAQEMRRGEKVHQEKDW
ncbi:MAG: VWA domain-containing protein [Bacteroidales bacterium]|nr:VWA domain-containing protein [Bacteroidales bacterium]